MRGAYVSFQRTESSIPKGMTLLETVQASDHTP
ncbi:hypothetical protein SAMN05444920_117128 [Nonomuraea solani]|uniref:Uncharacterized protein n=1 Tax=Nonomuraea solani TaxID=1144553 RepID=A0A1H6ES52_9ACTN|nr:hypothetical protein SAMN05444920_117128 [Nonomuraea solani]